MGKILSERRAIENEAIFRSANEQVLDDLDGLKKMNMHVMGDAAVSDTDKPLHFYCECSNDECLQRIVLKPSKYKDLHQNTSQFVLVPGHEIPELERTIQRTERYIVVEKFKSVPPKLV